MSEIKTIEVPIVHVPTAEARKIYALERIAAALERLVEHPLLSEAEYSNAFGEIKEKANALSNPRDK